MLVEQRTKCIFIGNDLLWSAPVMSLLFFSGKDLNSLLGSHFVLIQHHQRLPLLHCCLELYEFLVMTSETCEARTFKRVVREEKNVLKFSWLKHFHSECNQDQWSVFTWRQGGRVGVPKQSSVSWLLFLCKRFLFVPVNSIDAGHLSKNAI